MAPKKENVIDLSTLDVRELAALQEQLDGEVQSLTQSAVTLQRAAGGFGKSGRAIEQLAQQKEGSQSHALGGTFNETQHMHKSSKMLNGILDGSIDRIRHLTTTPLCHCCKHVFLIVSTSSQLSIC